MICLIVYSGRSVLRRLTHIKRKLEFRTDALIVILYCEFIKMTPNSYGTFLLLYATLQFKYVFYDNTTRTANKAKKKSASKT